MANNNLVFKTVENTDFVGIPLGKPKYFNGESFLIWVNWGDGSPAEVIDSYNHESVAWDRQNGVSPEGECVTIWKKYEFPGQYSIRIEGGFGQPADVVKDPFLLPNGALSISKFRTKHNLELCLADSRERGQCATPEAFEELSMVRTFIHGQGEFEGFKYLKKLTGLQVFRLTSNYADSSYEDGYIPYENSSIAYDPDGVCFFVNTFKNCQSLESFDSSIDWNSETEYKINEKVFYDGKTWKAKTVNRGEIPSTGNSANWTKDVVGGGVGPYTYRELWGLFRGIDSLVRLDGCFQNCPLDYNNCVAWTTQTTLISADKAFSFLEEADGDIINTGIKSETNNDENIFNWPSWLQPNNIISAKQMLAGRMIGTPTTKELTMHNKFMRHFSNCKYFDGIFEGCYVNSYLQNMFGNSSVPDTFVGQRKASLKNMFKDATILASDMRKWSDIGMGNIAPTSLSGFFENVKILTGASLHMLFPHVTRTSLKFCPDFSRYAYNADLNNLGNNINIRIPNRNNLDGSIDTIDLSYAFAKTSEKINSQYLFSLWSAGTATIKAKIDGIYMENSSGIYDMNWAKVIPENLNYLFVNAISPQADTDINFRFADTSLVEEANYTFASTNIKVKITNANINPVASQLTNITLPAVKSARSMFENAVNFKERILNMFRNASALEDASRMFAGSCGIDSGLIKFWGPKIRTSLKKCRAMFQGNTTMDFAQVGEWFLSTTENPTTNVLTDITEMFADSGLDDLKHQFYFRRWNLENLYQQNPRSYNVVKNTNYTAMFGDLSDKSDYALNYTGITTPSILVPNAIINPTDIYENLNVKIKDELSCPDLHPFQPYDTVFVNYGTI